MKLKKSKDKRLFEVFGYLLVLFVSFTCVAPLILVVSGSFTDEGSIIRDGYRLVPKIFSTKAYGILFDSPESMLRAYGVTILITAAGTVTGLFMTAMASYVLQRKDFKYRNACSLYFYFTTLFSGGLVPWYILMVQYLQMKKHPLIAMVIPGLFSVFYIIVLKTFFTTIPAAISESAKIDGAGDFRIFTELILPLSKPALATIGLFLALGYWNEWYNAMLFVNSELFFPLQYFLYRILNSVNFANAVASAAGIPMPEMPSESFKLAMTVITTGPIIFLYPFVQRYFVKGITIGAVKG